MHSLTEENYLKAIYKLSCEGRNSVSTNQIAETIHTKASSVTDMLKKLSGKSLINYVKYQGVTLTKEGHQAAVKIVRKHRLWEVFLVDKLHFKWDEVHDIAEELEHIPSDILIDRLEEFLGYPDTDPHGDLIPDKNGNFHQQELNHLSEGMPGRTCVIAGVNEHSSLFLQYLEKNGLTLGKEIKVKEVIDYDGSVILSIKDEKEVTISRDAAKNILIIYE